MVKLLKKNEKKLPLFPHRDLHSIPFCSIFRDQVIRIITWALTSAFLIMMGFIFFTVFFRGGSSMSLDYLFGSVMSAGRSGGVYPVLISTIWITTLALTITVIAGLPTALALSHRRFRNVSWTKITRTSLEILATVPSVVYGLFGHLLFVKFLGFGYSLISGSLTLALMCLPYFVRLLDEAFQQTTDDIWTTAEALSLSYFTFATKILLRSNKSLFITALTLSLSRALSETVALIFTSGYSTRLPESIWDSGRTLSVHIMDLALNVTNGDSNAYKSAFILLTITFIFQLLARGILSWQSQSTY